MLASQVGRLVFQAMILRRIWGAADADDSQYLRVCIRQLRTKTGADAPIHTIYSPSRAWDIAFGSVETLVGVAQL